MTTIGRHGNRNVSGKDCIDRLVCKNSGRVYDNSTRKCLGKSQTVKSAPSKPKPPPVVKCGKDQKRVAMGTSYTCKDLPCPAGRPRMFPGWGCGSLYNNSSPFKNA